MDKLLVLFLLSLPSAAPKGSHSFWLLATYMRGQTPFPQFSYILMLDDVRVLYYNGDTRTFIRRGNTTDENHVFDSNVLLTISDYIGSFFRGKWEIATNSLNKTDVKGALVLQRLVLCEMKDNGKPGQMITRDAFEGFTTDELRYIDNNFTYQGTLNVTAQVLKIHLEVSMWRHKHLYLPTCLKTLKGYTETRKNQISRKVKPKIRLFQKDQSFGSQVSCLATGFYPRHISLSMLRDGQPVSDHEITGGDLLPNDDGTYQMRKILRISAAEQRKKHKYTCTATHLSLDNKLDISLEYDHGTPLKSMIISVLTALALVLILGAVAAVILYRKGDRQHLKKVWTQYFDGIKLQKPSEETSLNNVQ
ncbi:MHC class I polypeptide-related sequence B [Triplophysa tibetana]|uniref:MHC class I polypeptide-related sequence B n=1 Tax=Triplophysa tibetana TaxID=1572043 RepID=A0A5A9PSF6_9TELE|nr:MHC class I polypeptide-related sequence B [Triplophysa tibetana]